MKTSISVALVSQNGLPPTCLSGVRLRKVLEPQDVQPHDDVLLFYGPDMARELGRFTAGLGKTRPAVAVLAPELDWGDAAAALEHEAVSYLLENRSYADSLAGALRCASQGIRLLDPVVATEQHRLARLSRDREQDRPERAERAASDARDLLTRREQQLMELLSTGLTVRESADGMNLTEKSARNSLARIYAKLGVRGQAQALLLWLGHLPPGSCRTEPPYPSHLSTSTSVFGVI